MTAPIVLVVNADDFGQSPEVTDGVLTAHRDGIVTSTSLMVRWPSAADAAVAARACPHLSLGLHVDLGEWRWDAGQWRPVYEVVDPGDANSVRAEFARQLDRFRALVGRDPTHLDSHQHVHRRAPVREVVLAAGRALGIPVRHSSPWTYVGDFYGQSDEGLPLPALLTEDHLIRILERLTPGRWELTCHPAAAPVPEAMYAQERVRELAILTAPRVRQAITGRGLALGPFPLPPRP